MKEQLEESSRPKFKFSNIPGIENLSTGPLQTNFRSCTDPLCCIILLMIMIYFIGVGFSAIFMGDVDLIGAPYDPNHRACGVDTEALDYPYIYFATPNIDETGNYLYRTVCLMECPIGITSNVYTSNLKCLTNNVVTSCSFKSSPQNVSVLFYNTVPYLGKVCLPEATLYFTMVQDYIDAGWVTNVIVDVKHSFFMISISLLLTCFFALLILKSLQWCDKVIIHSLIGIYFLFLLIFGVGFIYKGFSTSEIDASLVFQNSSDLINSASISSTGLLVLIIVGSILVLLAFATSIYLCFHRDYFKFLTRIVKTTFEILSQNNLLVLFAVCLYVILWIIIMTTIALALYIYSVGSVEEGLSINLYYPFNQFQNSNFYYYNLWGLLFFMIWIAYFFLGFYQFVTMGTASNWYFRDNHIDAECRRKGQKRLAEEISYSSKHVIKSYIRLGLTKHFGSIAFGAFMILIFGWLNTLLTFIKEKLEITYRRHSAEKSCFNSIYNCHLWFFNKYIRNNTEIAYMMMAYRGDPYIISGIYTSYIIDEYYEIFSEISALTNLLAVGLNIVCSLVPSVIFYYVFEYIPWYGLYLSSSLHPALVIGLLAFINVRIFNTIFGNIVDALLICYCIDKESLSYERKLLHFNKDPDFQQIPKEPSLQNKLFLRSLIELFNEKFKIADQVNSEINIRIQKDVPQPIITQKKLPKKTVIVTSQPDPQNNNQRIQINNGLGEQNYNQRQPIYNNRYVEQYSLPKVNDIIRGSSPIKHVWMIEEKQQAASKHRLIQQSSPFKESPFSEIIRNKNESGFYFQKEGFNLDLKLDENF